jgi:SWI/SNF-related matrix-associated actin-dependent regulator 1 of chromatin subfamily A
MMILRPFQQIGKQFLIDRKYALLADDMGLGKTVQVLAALEQETTSDFLVISPHIAKKHWVRTAKEFSLPEINLVSAENSEILKGANVINYELLHRDRVMCQLKRRKWQTVVIDESHRIKSHKAKQTRIILGGLLKNTEKMWFLSGSPILNNPIDLFPILRACVSDKIAAYNTYMPFMMRYCNPRSTPWGVKPTGVTNVDELKRMLDGFMLRRLKTDVLPELPEVEYTAVYCDERPITKRFVEEAKKEYEARGLTPQFDFINQKLSLEKIDESVEFIKEIMEQKKKLVVYAHHRAVVEALYAQLKEYNSVVYYGGMTNQQRENVLTAFTTNEKTKIFIGSIDAVSVALDGLQRVADTCVFVEMAWTPELNNQAVSRLHRMGQNDGINAYFLVYENSIDEQIVAALKRKEGIIGSVIAYDGTFAKTNTKKRNDVKIGKKGETMNRIEFSINGNPALVITGTDLKMVVPMDIGPIEVEPEKKAQTFASKKEPVESFTPVLPAKEKQEVTSEVEYITRVNKANIEIAKLQKEGVDVQPIITAVKKKCQEFGVTSARAITDPKQQTAMIDAIIAAFKQVRGKGEMTKKDDVL